MFKILFIGSLINVFVQTILFFVIFTKETKRNLRHLDFSGNRKEED